MNAVNRRLVRALAGVAVAAAAATAVPLHAQERIFRCANNEFINNETEARNRNCSVVQGGNLSVVQGVRPQAGSTAGSSAGAGAGSAATPRPVASAGPRVNEAEQRARDSDARAIFESELRKAELKHAELLKEYNNGQPDRRGDEIRNYQKYLDRVAELKANIARNESDMEGLRRELSRLPAATP